MWLLQKDAPLALRWSNRVAALNALCFAATAALLGIARAPVVLGARLYTVLLLVAAAATFVTSFFLLLSFKEVRAKLASYGFRSVYGGIAALCLVTYPLILEAVWRPLAKVTEVAVFNLLRVLGVGVWMGYCEGNLAIKHPTLNAYISMGCSGLEGIFFFLFTFALLRLFEKHRGGHFRAAIIAVAGIGYMFLLNVVRITLFFVAAINLAKFGDRAQGRDFVMWAFHSNIGWILYLGGLALFFYVVGVRNRFNRSSASAI
jgi:exosortase/archaeosortase family protein